MPPPSRSRIPLMDRSKSDMAITSLRSGKSRAAAKPRRASRRLSGKKPEPASNSAKIGAASKRRGSAKTQEEEGPAFERRPLVAPLDINNNEGSDDELVANPSVSSESSTERPKKSTGRRPEKKTKKSAGRRPVKAPLDINNNQQSDEDSPVYMTRDAYAYTLKDSDYGAYSTIKKGVSRKEVKTQQHLTTSEEDEPMKSFDSSKPWCGRSRSYSFASTSSKAKPDIEHLVNRLSTPKHSAAPKMYRPLPRRTSRSYNKNLPIKSEEKSKSLSSAELQDFIERMSIPKHAAPKSPQPKQSGKECPWGSSCGKNYSRISW